MGRELGRIWKELYERKEYDKIYHMKKIGRKTFPSVVRKGRKEHILVTLLHLLFTRVESGLSK